VPIAFPGPLPRVAVVGSGITGLATAYALRHQARVTLFEAGAYFGGHTHTVDVTLPGAKTQADPVAPGPITHGVDTGFLVFNHRTYPNLVRLFGELGVVTAASDMSFSVQVPEQGLEWSGCNLNTVFAQRRNLLRPRFLRMLADVLRFNKLATAIAERGDDVALAEPIGAFLDRHQFNPAFRDWYFLPMIGCIWSCPTDQMLQFPVGTMIRFCHNHGLIQVANRPQWHTVRGGAKHYVQKLLQHIPDTRLNSPVRGVRRLPLGLGNAGVMVATESGSEHFDHVVLACHSDQSLALLDDASADERAILGAIRYHPNRAVLHTDTSLLPKRPLAWAAWNYARAANTSREQAGVCLHYLINRLQPLPWSQPVLVSLNPDPSRPPQAHKVLGEFAYSHPVFDRAAVHAQKRLAEIQGRSRLWFAGAWTRYGFHEDGLMSAQAVVQGLREQWQQQDSSGAQSRAA
jgi:uncharacterized protein